MSDYRDDDQAAHVADEVRRRGEVVLTLDNDTTVIDEQTIEHECLCGDVLDLPHLYDWDTEVDYFGGDCKRCGEHIEVLIITKA